MARHFLERLRFVKSKFEDRPNCRFHLNRTCLKDIEIMLVLLENAKKGINMNLLTFRSPDNQWKVDACPHGLGGFSTTGRAWRWPIPTDLVGYAHINLLEFLATLIALWLDIVEGTLKPIDCVLIMGDSTTAMGWLHRTRIQQPDVSEKDYVARTKIARKAAELVWNKKVCLYSQWFPGKENVVADSLSRDLDVPANVLTTYLLSLFPSLLPQAFQISPLPSEITQFACSILSELKSEKRSRPVHTTSDVHPGHSGVNSGTMWDSETTSFWLASRANNATPSSPCSPEREEPRVRMGHYVQDTSEIPSVMYHRSSGALGIPTQV